MIDRRPLGGGRHTRACGAVNFGEHQAVVLAAVLPGPERSAGPRPGVVITPAQETGHPH